MKINYNYRFGKAIAGLSYGLDKACLFESFGIDKKEDCGIYTNTFFPDYSIDEMPELKKQFVDLNLQKAIVSIDPRYISKIDPARIKNKEDLKNLIKTALEATKDIFYRQSELGEYSKEEQKAREEFVKQVIECVNEATDNYEAHCQMEGSLNSLVESGEEE